MLEKISWTEIIVYSMLVGIVFYIMLYTSLVSMFIKATKTKLTWKNIKKILFIFK